MATKIKSKNSRAIATTKPSPFIKWVGGKGKLIEQFKPHIPCFINYYEAFTGGGAMFFALASANAVLVDKNIDLITTYKCVRDCPDLLIKSLEHYQAWHCEEQYYKTREIYRDRTAYDSLTLWSRAAIFIYLNKTCFNGLYRTNKKGQFNSPLGRYANPAIYQPSLINAASEALQNTQLIAGDFSAIASLATLSDDFVYFDPPYYPLNKTSNFTSYTQDGFNPADQVRLRDLCVELRSRGVKVMISNSDCEYIRNLYQDFNLHQIWAARAINCKASDRGKISELLITGY